MSKFLRLLSGEEIAVTTMANNGDGTISVTNPMLIVTSFSTEENMTISFVPFAPAAVVDDLVLNYNYVAFSAPLQGVVAERYDEIIKSMRPEATEEKPKKKRAVKQQPMMGFSKAT
jgi:hypothetical protein